MGTPDDTITVSDVSKQFRWVKHDRLIQIDTPILENIIEKNIHTMADQKNSYIPAGRLSPVPQSV